MTFLPPPGITRRLCLQSGLYAIGSGTFVACNAVFFTQVLGLSAVQVGTGLTIAALLTMILALPLGRLADRWGHRRVWAIGAAAESLCYVAYPLIRGFTGFVVVVAILAVIEGVGSSGRSGYTYAVVRGPERTKTMAFVRTSLNIGFTLGAGLAAIALAIGSQAALICLPLVAAAFMAVNAFLISRLPAAPAFARAEKQFLGALRDLPFVVVQLLSSGVAGFHGVIAMTLIPLWLVSVTNAPHGLTAWLFALNTVLAVGFQVRATRNIKDVRSGARAIRGSLLILAVACVVLMLSAGKTPFAASMILVLAMILATAAELWQSGGQWQLMGDLAPAERRGEYAGAATICRQATQCAAPAVITWLTLGWRAEGWLVVAAFLVVCSVGMIPAAAWAERTRPWLRDENVSASP